MQNNISIEKENEKNIPHSFAKFEELYTLSETNPLIVVDLNGNIVFMNNSFKNSFKLKKGINFFELETEPDLGFLLSSLSGSSYNNFSFDLIFTPGIDLDEYEYNIELERIFIHANEYFLVIFYSQKEKRKLEERMNNLHNALDYGKIPVLITNNKGIITYATNSFEKILQTNIESIYKKSIVETLSIYLTKEELKEVEDAIYNSHIWTKTIPCIEDKETITYK